MKQKNTSKSAPLGSACGVMLILVVLTLSVAAQAADYTVTTNAGAITITKYTGSGGEVTIPGTINGLPVTVIGYRAFLNCTSLTRVVIPDSVTSIGDYAFYYCTGLTNATLSANVTSIGVSAFYRCVKLAGITIPASVTSVGYGAFEFCTSLANITIPSGVTSIGNYAFNSCTNLSAVTVDEANLVYSSLDGVLFDKEQTAIICYPRGKFGDYVVPSTVTDIGDYTFYNCNRLTGILIPDNVLSIGYGAFYSCAGLTNVIVSANAGAIGDSAFAECVSLVTVEIPEGVTEIADWAFYSCTSLVDVIIPDSVTRFGFGSFESCYSLVSVTVGAGVTYIDDEAFYDCTGLLGVYCRGNAPELGGPDVFTGDDNTIVYYLLENTGWDTTYGGCPTEQWNPQLQASADSFAMSGAMNLNISWTSGMTVVVEATTSLASGEWVPVATNTLVDGSVDFTDPQGQDYPTRFYRIRTP